MFGIPITGPTATSVTRYLIVLSIVIVMTWVASNLVHGRVGRMWMSVRDMDLAAELIGIRLLRVKLLAFAIGAAFEGGEAGGRAFARTALSSSSPGMPGMFQSVIRKSNSPLRSRGRAVLPSSASTTLV